MKYTVKERFLTYVQIDTQADPESDTAPSTAKQKDMTKQLVKELNEMGVEHQVSEQGYVYATIPGNTDKADVPKIFFCAHVDTAPDAPGTDVKPIVHENYQGEKLVLPDDPTLFISPENFPEINEYLGQDIITASGKTLLGADDKSGVATIMDAAYQLVNNPEIEHGDVMLFFTTDEEIGRGVAHVDLDILDADYGYTLDSGPIGHLENENFSADGATLTIQGVSAHPGYAKGKMENAIKIASEIIAALPKDELSPESTEERKGFIHPGSLEAELGGAKIKFILRSFDTDELPKLADKIRSISDDVLKNYPGSSYELETKLQYRNMIDEVKKYPHIIDNAVEAMKNAEIKPHLGLIRGGTDGAVLTSKGLPCPNIFSGQHGIHSKLEWTTVQEMQKAVDTILEICKVTVKNA